MIDELRTGGTETHLLRLIDNLDRDVVTPYLCLLCGDKESSRKLEPKDCEILRLHVNSLLSPTCLAESFRFWRTLRRWRIDLLQVHFPDSTYFGVPVAKLAGVRKITRTRRDLFYWVTPVHLRFGKYLDRIYNRLFVDRLITNCRAVQEAACQDESLGTKRVLILENGIDLEPFLELPPVTTGDREGIHVGSVSMLRPEKRSDLLVAAAGLLADSHPDMTWSVAGEGQMRATLESTIDELGLNPRFQLPGRITDIAGYLGQLDVWVLCSDTEGQSNALIEAMAAGRAVVATDVGGNAELIEDGVNGLLFKPGDAHALADCLQRLASDKDLRGKLGQAARKTAAERFSLPQMIHRYQDYYLQECAGTL